MYDLLNDNAGRERLQELIKIAEQERLAHAVQTHQANHGLLAQVRIAIVRTVSALIR